MLQEIHLKVAQIAGHLLTSDAQEEEEEIAGTEDEAKIASTDGQRTDGGRTFVMRHSSIAWTRHGGFELSLQVAQKCSKSMPKVCLDSCR